MFGNNAELKEKIQVLEEQIQKKDSEILLKESEIKELRTITNSFFPIKESKPEDINFQELCLNLGLKRQAFIGKVEAETGTKFMSWDEEAELLWKKVEIQMCIPGTKRSYRSREITWSSVEEFSGKLTTGILLKYMELKNYFDKIRIMHPTKSTDPILYGIKVFEGEEICFKILEW